MSPSPERYGGGAPLLELILDGLNAARGTAYDTSQGSNVYAENMAYARAIVAAWSTNRRLSNQADPSRMTSMLPRWEKIFGIVPAQDATEVDRRAEVARRWARVGVTPSRQAIIDELVSVLGRSEGTSLGPGLFVDMVSDTVSTARTFWPSGTPNVDAPWYSTTALVTVVLDKPFRMSEDEFYQRAGQIAPILDARLPAWCGYQWIRGVGFFLDDEHNLDNEGFDS